MVWLHFSAGGDAAAFFFELRRPLGPGETSPEGVVSHFGTRRLGFMSGDVLSTLPGRYLLKVCPHS